MLNQSNYSNNIAFSRDVTAAILVFQKKPGGHIGVYQTCPLRVELYFIQNHLLYMFEGCS